MKVMIAAAAAALMMVSGPAMAGDGEVMVTPSFMVSPDLSHVKNNHQEKNSVIVEKSDCRKKSDRSSRSMARKTCKDDSAKADAKKEKQQPTDRR